MKLMLAVLLTGCLLAPPLLSSVKSQRGQGVRIKTGNGQEIDLYDESHALVIGVGNYTNGWRKLPGAVKDAEVIGALLRKQGFQVTDLLNPGAQQLNESLAAFISDHGLRERNRLVIYFAGHGHTEELADGRELGYIIPADAPLPARDPNGFSRRAISMDEIEAKARRIISKHAMFVFDSCFSGSIFEVRSGSFAPPEIESKIAQPVRMFISAGTKNQTVPDDSVFRRYFVRAFEERAGDLNRDGFITGEELGVYLAGRVATDSRDAQTPRYGKIRDAKLNLGDIVFVLPGGASSAPRVVAAPETTPAPRVDPVALELALWQSADRSDDIADYEEYLRQYPQGRFAGMARNRVAKFRKDTALSNRPESSFQGVWKGTWRDGRDFFDCEVTFEPGPDNNIKGFIRWTLRQTSHRQFISKIGLSATEYIRGTYDPSQRLLIFEGYKEDDPHNVIDLDQYRLSLSEDGSEIQGKTSARGMWRPEIRLSRMKFRPAKQ